MKHPVDTLYMDSKMLDDLASNDDFDYSRELIKKESTSLWDIIEKWLDDFFDVGSEYKILKDYGEWIVVFIVLAIIVTAIIIYIRNHPELFDKKVHDDKFDYETGVDSIYGVDFESLLNKARNGGDYNEVVRLVYLQTLRLLNDREIIKWRLYKTPTQYTREYRTNDFRKFTNLFLRVRYGGYAANFEDTEVMDSLSRNIVKSISSVKASAATEELRKTNEEVQNVTENVNNTINVEKGGIEA
ncbi:MAG: DUF4129 domain-containing protein [Bacteroidaceae bacterium]|nr:DUF4129 domain-containing protein [Bacteroidaceae bacterium]